MSNKRPNASQGGNDRRKKKYRSDGTPVWGKRYIDGPGIWVTCIKGKEKQAVGELYELFNGLAAELWPEAAEGANGDDDSDDAETEEGLSIEAQIANEVSAMKRPKKEQRFTNCQTNTPCVVFISCKPPIDPVKLVMKHVQNVHETGLTHTRYSLRFSPVSAACVTNLPEIQALCRTAFEPFFGDAVGQKFKYKIELRIRNHTTLSRSELIEAIAKCVPEGHTVDLDHAELFILVEVFKSICGVSVVRDYSKLQKFNVVEIANTHASENPATSVTRIE
ncbi:hypothetical protein DFH08DRAFT_923852 [Mycena albidolilacea]|uniref:THUMP domain-containing protein n=1 Tax=Mycena albidolilacea TaxID=1033008 RepID=A0AAD7A3M6_9AGAR|nr:hypothetical protein DFH08DRAFT_923852 [Mycena albidolilacea]